MADYKEFLRKQATRALANYMQWSEQAIKNIRNGEPLCRTPLVAVEYYQDFMMTIKTMQVSGFEIDFEQMYQEASKMAAEFNL